LECPKESGRITGCLGMKYQTFKRSGKDMKGRTFQCNEEDKEKDKTGIESQNQESQVRFPDSLPL